MKTWETRAHTAVKSLRKASAWQVAAMSAATVGVS